MAKSNKKGLLLIAALGALSFGALTVLKKPGDVVTGKSGKAWRVVLIGTSGATHTYEVFAPAGTFGPHEELSVLRYSQTGSDQASRKLVGKGAGVPVAITQAAGADFGVPVV